MDFWGKGIESEMLRAVIQWAPNAGIERLELTVGKHTVRARALYERVGFVLEGTQTGAVKVNGMLEDEHTMGLLLLPSG